MTKIFNSYNTKVLMAFVPSYSVHMMVPYFISRRTKVTLFLASLWLGIRLGSLGFSTSTLSLSGLSRNNIHPAIPMTINQIANQANLPFWDPQGDLPLPEGKIFYIELPSIHHHSFLDELFAALQFINNPSSGCSAANTLPPEYLDSATLGKLKLEHEIKEGIFALPKVYYLETTDGKFVTKAKGYSGQLTKEQYLNLINEINITNLTMNKWFRSLKDSTILIKRNQPYEIRYLFNKRRRTGFNTTLPYHT